MYEVIFRNGGSNLPPVTRNVTYEFTRGELKGAVFKGSMTQVSVLLFVSLS